MKGSYALSEALMIEGSWQRFTNSAIEPNNGQGTAGTGDGVLDRNVEKDITTDTFRFGLGFNPVSNDWLDLSLTAYQTSSDVDEFDATVPRTTVRDIETTGFSARNASRFSLGRFESTLTVGGDWYKDEQTGIDDQTGTVHDDRIGPATVWTQAQCDARLASDLEHYASEVARAIGGAPTTQAQFDALVSFHYNTGAIHRATLTKKHRAGDYEGAAAEFARWNKAGGRVLKGLVRRRAAEAKLYRGE